MKGFLFIYLFLTSLNSTSQSATGQKYIGLVLAIYFPLKKAYGSVMKMRVLGRT